MSSWLTTSPLACLDLGGTSFLNHSEPKRGMQKKLPLAKSAPLAPAGRAIDSSEHNRHLAARERRLGDVAPGATLDRRRGTRASPECHSVHAQSTASVPAAGPGRTRTADV